MEEEEGGDVGEWFVGYWFEPFSEEFGCSVEEFVESLCFFGRFLWRQSCVIWRDWWLSVCWSDCMLVRWFLGGVSPNGYEPGRTDYLRSQQTMP